MARIRSLNIDLDYNQAEVNAALDLLVALTDDIAAIMEHMSRDKRLDLWKTNNTTRTLGRKLLQIDENLDNMDPRGD